MRLLPPHHLFVLEWSLSLVLAKLRVHPFKLMATTEICLLTWKMAFLIAITSAKRSSDLCAFMAGPPFIVFHKDKVVLHPDPVFLPKVLSSFICLSLLFSLFISHLLLMPGNMRSRH